MTKAYFIAEQSFREYTPATELIDISLIKPHIRSAQDIEITYILGSKLCNELQEKVIAATLSEKETELLDLIKICLSWYTFFYALEFLRSRVTNKSVNQKNSTESTVASLDDVLNLKQLSQTQAVFYANRIKEYLQHPDNMNDFPSYINQDFNGIVAKKSFDDASPIYIGDDNRTGRRHNPYNAPNPNSNN